MLRINISVKLEGAYKNQRHFLFYFEETILIWRLPQSCKMIQTYCLCFTTGMSSMGLIILLIEQRQRGGANL